MYFIGLDAGTSGVKAVAFNEKGREYTREYAPYPYVQQRQGYLEIEPEFFINAVYHVIKKTCEICGKKNIRAIAVSAFGEAFLAIDESGNALTNIILSTDIRGRDEFGWLSSKIGLEVIVDKTGLVPSPTYSAPKMLWIKKHKPDVFENARKYLLIEDYIQFKLTGEMVIDFSAASRTMCFNVKEGCWDKEILKYLELGAEKFSSPVKSGQVIGKINTETANMLGLSRSTMVIAGGHDQPCGALGAGCIQTGDVANSCGTTESITPVLKEALKNEDILQYQIPLEPFLIEGRYNTMAYNHTAGLALSWFIDNIYYKKTGGNHQAAFVDLENRCKNLSTSVMTLPHFSGAATPYMDHASRAAFVGMKIGTTIEELYLSLIESLVFEMKFNLDNLNLCGILPKQMVVFGGGAKSELWLNLKAAILDTELVIHESEEVGALGAAIQCAVSTGVYGTHEEAIENMVRYKEVILPNHSLQESRARKYEIYCGLYRDLKSINHSIK